MRIFIALFAFGALAASAATFDFGPVIVPGTANIFAAGGNTALNPNYGLSDGTLPPSLSFAAAPSGSYFTFGATNGPVTCSGLTGGNDPDGTCIGFGVDTNMNSAGSISGLKVSDNNMFIVGVFTDGGVPAGPAPARLNYGPGQLALNALSYTPLLNQVFFIGDGLTGTGFGTQQQFYVPDGATQVHLGFVDGWALFQGFFQGNNGFYNDNQGAFSMTGQLTTPDLSEVPEPGTFVVAGLGLALVALRRYRS